MEASDRLGASEVAGVAIVGGGVAGLLQALMLSRVGGEGGEPDASASVAMNPRDLVLFESSPTLGGRLFSTASGSHVGLNSEERFQLIKQELQGGQVSGLGWEAWGVASWELLQRHLESLLSEDELVFLGDFLPIKADSTIDSALPFCAVIKKQQTPWAELLTGSTEWLTRKEAESWALLVEQGKAFWSAAQAGHHEPEAHRFDFSPEMSFAAWDLWSQLKPSIQEALVPLIETIVQVPLQQAPLGAILHSLGQWACECVGAVGWPLKGGGNGDAVTPLRLRGLERGLEAILRRRGVKLRTSCRVLRCVKAPDASSFSLRVSDDVHPQTREWQVAQVVFALPLVQLLGVVERPFLTPAQSKAATRWRPRSIVSLEAVDGLGDCWKAQWPGGSQLLCPHERVRVTIPVGSPFVCLWTCLDYESSLSAPAVKEAVQRLRKAAARLAAICADKSSLQPTAAGVSHGADGVRKNLSLAKNTPRERLILTPVGLLGTRTAGLKPQDVRLALPGLYVVGEALADSLAQPLRGIVESVRTCSVQVLQKIQSGPCQIYRQGEK